MTSTQAVRETADGRKLFPQSVVRQRPPPPPTSINILTEKPVQLQSYGENILLFVPTANEFKTKVLYERIRAELKEPQNLLILHSEDFESGAGQQPYDEMGLKGALNRIINSVAWLNTNKTFLEEKKVGTVLVAAIENYIRRGEPAVDYGIVIMYNATANNVATVGSRGVEVPADFLKEAEACGFDDRGKKCGKKTVGKVLAEVFGVDHRDWQKVVCGISRYQLLREAVTKLNVPL